MNHVIATVIYSTREYSRFHLIIGNRELSQRKITKLTRDIEQGFDMTKECPVIVVEKGDRLHIIDGQHRFWVARSLRKPIYYVISKDIPLENIARMNSCTEKWANKDYIHCYSQQENSHYQQLREFMERYNVPAATALPLLSNGLLISNGGHENLSEQMKNGTYEVKDLETATRVMTECERFKAFRQWRTRPFVTAISQLMNDEADIEAIAHAYKGQPNALTLAATPGQYKRMLQSLVMEEVAQ